MLDIALMNDDDDATAYCDIRDSLTYLPDHLPDDAPYAFLIDRLDRESLTDLTLSLSLCPIHFLDYAICFDDADPECAAIRRIHPSHDT